MLTAYAIGVLAGVAIIFTVIVVHTVAEVVREIRKY
jgi:hypothetical protein